MALLSNSTITSLNQPEAIIELKFQELVLKGRDGTQHAKLKKVVLKTDFILTSNILYL